MIAPLMVAFLLAVLAAAGTDATFQPDGNRVVSGTDTDIESWPYMVSVRRNNVHKCGGTAINPFWVMTAAHCTQNTDLTQYSIRHSSSVIGNEIEDDFNVLSVAQIWNHENFNASDGFIHDISLIRLERPMNIYKFARLPRRQFEDYVHGTAARLIGWGLNETGGSMQTQLQQVDLMVFSDEECARRHSARPPHQSNVCGGVPEGGRGQCNGDSGGPLLVNGIQVGIVSWSEKPCAVYPYPGVFTQVSYYFDWVRQRAGSWSPYM